MLLALIMLTALDGTPVWVESTAIQIIRPARTGNKQCGESVGAGIRIGTTSLCVRETPEQIQRQIKDAR